MKLQPDRVAHANVITRYGPGGVQIGERQWTASLVLPWQGEVRTWNVAGLEQLEATHFETIAALEPELLLFGSGPRLRFLSPAVLRPLIERGIGIETMDTAAACRTYNLLVAEGRRVVAALLIDAA